MKNYVKHLQKKRVVQQTSPKIIAQIQQWSTFHHIYVTCFFFPLLKYFKTNPRHPVITHLPISLLWTVGTSYVTP